MNRRSFLALLSKAGAAVIAAIVAIPVLLFALSPAIRKRAGPVWVPVGTLDEFALATVTKAVVVPPAAEEEPNHSVREKGVFVWRPTEEEIVVFARSCTDLGCPVTWDPGSGWYFCPCHGGIFAEDGRNVAGPPSRPMYRYVSRIRGNVLEIDLRSLPPMT